MFELPKYKGIEEAMHDVKVHVRDKQIERCIGLLPDGRRVYDVVGDGNSVQNPDWATGTKDLFIVHGHPWTPTELSPADIMCIPGLEAVGNMAVCAADDTVSWTTGPGETGLPYFIFTLMAADFTNNVARQCLTRLDPDLLKGKDEGKIDWGNNDERHVVLSHLMNASFLENKFIRDFHLQSGAVHADILARWLPKLQGAQS
jgi:hypothetical protein